MGQYTLNRWASWCAGGTDDGDPNIDDDPVDSWHCPPPIQINAVAICGGAALVHGPIETCKPASNHMLG